MIATTLHSIAVGNLLPAWVKVVCVDINPSTVIKLNDRGIVPDRRPGDRRRAVPAGAGAGAGGAGGEEVTDRDFLVPKLRLGTQVTKLCFESGHDGIAGEEFTL